MYNCYRCHKKQKSTPTIIQRYDHIDVISKYNFCRKCTKLFQKRLGIEDMPAPVTTITINEVSWSRCILADVGCIGTEHYYGWYNNDWGGHSV